MEKCTVHLSVQHFLPLSYGLRVGTRPLRGWEEASQLPRTHFIVKKRPLGSSLWDERARRGRERAPGKQDGAVLGWVWAWASNKVWLWVRFDWPRSLPSFTTDLAPLSSVLRHIRYLPDCISVCGLMTVASYSALSSISIIISA